jgi:hypothetical protein
MAFSLPSAYTAETAPTPRGNIQLSDNKPLLAAVLEFPGYATDRQVELTLAELRAGVAESSNFELAEGAPFEYRTLQYNPPYTIPWRRLNAVMIPVTETVAPESTEAESVDATPVAVAVDAAAEAAALETYQSDAVGFVEASVQSIEDAANAAAAPASAAEVDPEDAADAASSATESATETPNAEETDTPP